MTNLKFLFYLFFLLILFKKNLSTEIKDITPIGDDSYTPNIIYTTGSQCGFRKLLFCTGDCGSVSINPTSVSIVQIVANSTSSIFSLFAYVQNYTTITFNGTDSNYSVSFECRQINIDSITGFKLVGSYYRFPEVGSFGTTIVGLFKMEGLDLNIKKSKIDFKYSNIIFNSSSTMSYYYADYFLYQYYSFIPSTFNFSSNISFTFYNSTNSKSFQLEPFFKDNINSIVNIDGFIYYPNNLNINNTIGYDLGPVLKFTTNTTAYNSFFSIKKNNTDYPYMFYPINGNQNYSTFLFPLDSFDASTNYTIYSKNGSGFNEIKSFSEVYTKQYEFKTPIISGSSVYTTLYNIQLPILNIQISNLEKSSLTPFKISVFDITVDKNFPYGFISSIENGFIYNISTVVLPFYKTTKYVTDYSVLADIDGSGRSFAISNLITPNYVNFPIINNIEVIHLVSNMFLYRVNATIENSLLYFIKNDIRYGPETLVYGNLTNGIFEIVELTMASSFGIADCFYGVTAITSFSPIYKPNGEIGIYIPPYNDKIDLFSISNISYLYNDIDVSNHRHYNIFYFNYTDQNIPRDGVFVLNVINQEVVQDFYQMSRYSDAEILKNSFYSTWNQTLKLFQIEFYIEANSLPGDFQFALNYGSINLVVSNSFDTQLRIKNSNLDLQGPIIKNITKNGNYNIVSNSNSGINFSISIEDSINGFEKGFITIRGEKDLSIYNFTFDSSDLVSGDIFLGTFEFNINISYPCISQNYTITHLLLLDRVNRVSSFSIYNKHNMFASVINPFMGILDIENINKFSLTCASDPIASTDTTPPILTSFTSSANVLNVGNADRRVTFNFTALDQESGLKYQQYPIVYLTAIDNNILECKSSIVSINSTTATYTCTIQVPLSFGHPNFIILSVYGFINNNGLYSGYSTNGLIDLGFTSRIDVNAINNSQDYSNLFPIISKYFPIRDTGGDLWLFGRGFNVTSSFVHFSFSDGPQIVMTSSIIYPTALLVKNVKPTDKPYKVYVSTIIGNSENITVTPIAFDYYLRSPSNSTPTDTPTAPPTTTPIPTNSPQKCPGSPVCGGPLNGKCIESQGCVCISPWIGNDCLSQIVIIDPPKVNTSNGEGNNSGSPSIEIIVPDITNNTSGSGNNTTLVTYSSLVSLVSLREIDIYGNEINNYPIQDNWVSKQIENLTFAFYKSININNNQIVNITVTLKWFINETIVTFANEQLTMNPSTMKYTIEISNYPFANQLNQLQLIMSALIQSNTTDNICSSKEFGETSSGDNSNYLKIKIDKHSLYGRFIRRGIVDSKIRSVSNILLDSEMNPITETKSIQSYIGIQIPYFSSFVILDPDFSVLVDSYSASSNCNNHSKLSTGKIVGIVLGGVALTAVVIISIVYIIIKMKKDKKFLSNFSKKMKEINKDS